MGTLINSDKSIQIKWPTLNIKLSKKRPKSPHKLKNSNKINPFLTYLLVINPSFQLKSYQNTNKITILIYFLSTNTTPVAQNDKPNQLQETEKTEEIYQNNPDQALLELQGIQFYPVHPDDKTEGELINDD